jgi:hypothetical protein
LFKHNKQYILRGIIYDETTKEQETRSMTSNSKSGGTLAKYRLETGKEDNAKSTNDMKRSSSRMSLFLSKSMIKIILVFKNVNERTL